MPLDRPSLVTYIKRDDHFGIESGDSQRLPRTQQLSAYRLRTLHELRTVPAVPRGDLRARTEGFYFAATRSRMLIK
jgi:hypothetical protein